MKTHHDLSIIKKGSFPTLMIIGLLVFGSCSDDTKRGLAATDNIPPQVPVVTEIENINGASIIHYAVPKDKDLLCVEATYQINGVQRYAKASAYENKLKVEGFGKAGEYEITLKSMDKSRNESAPVQVKVNPLVSPVELIYESLQVSASFGGIRATWKNETESNIIVSMSLQDSLGDWRTLENFYSSQLEGLATLRGLDTIPQHIGVTIRDRWDNYSDRKEDVFKPLFEQELDKAKFRELTALPGGAKGHSTYPIRYIWDGNTVGTGDTGFYHGEINDIGKFLIFDLGVKAKISRFKMYQRTNADAFLYSHNNLKRYTIYGCDEITADMRESGSLDGWTKIMEVLCHKPSGDTGKVTNEDKEYILNGDEHEIPLDAPAFRVVRIEMQENWSGGTIPQIAEMTFWGQTIKN